MWLNISKTLGMHSTSNVTLRVQLSFFSFLADMFGAIEKVNKGD